MEQLQAAVTAAFEKIAASGVIEQAIEKKLTETVTSIVDKELNGYSDFGKAIGTHVKAALQVDFDTLGLPGYNDLILKIIRRQVAEHTSNSIARHVESQMSALLAPAPAEIKLSKLVADFIESKNDDDECRCDAPDRITLHVKQSEYGGWWIELDPESGKPEYRCEVRFGINSNNEIFALKLDDKDPKNQLFIGSIYGFERDLFQMYASGTKVIIDEDEDSIDTYYPGRRD